MLTMIEQDNALKLSKYIVVQNDDDYVYLFSTRSAELLKITHSKWQELSNNRLEHLDQSDLALLRELKILIPNNENELESLLDASVDPKSITDLNFVILPSSNCPLGCNLPQFGAYCGQTHKSGLLEPEHQYAFIQNLRNLVKPQHRKLIISWFGAEPLTGMSVITEMSKQLIQLSTELNLKYSSNVVTGGTLLTIPIAYELRECQVHSISLTIDGPKNVHDKRRCTKNGSPTFEKIVQNINAIIQDPSLAEMQISVRTNVDARNRSEIKEFIEFAANNRWQERVEINFAPVHPWGQLEDNEFALSKDDYASFEIEALEYLMAFGFSPQLLPTKRSLVCRVVSPFSGVLGHNGMMHKCSESPLTALDPMHDKLGTISAEKSEWDKTWNWKSTVQSGVVPCNDCVMLPVCGGGCPLAWNTGAHEPCPSAKRNINQRIELFVKQEHLPRTRALNVTPHRIVGFIKKSADIDSALIRDYENVLTSALIKASTNNFESASRSIIEARRIKLGFGLQLWIQLLADAAIAMVQAYVYFRQNALDEAEQSLHMVRSNLRRAQKQNQDLSIFASQFQAAVNLLKIREKSNVGYYQLAKGLKQTLESGRRLVFEGECLVNVSDDMDISEETFEEWMAELAYALNGSSNKVCNNFQEIATRPFQ